MSSRPPDGASSRNRIVLLAMALAVVIGVGVGAAYLVGVAQRTESTVEAPKSPASGSGAPGATEPTEPLSNPNSEPDPNPDAAATIGAASADTAGGGTPASGPTDAELVQVAEAASATPLSAAIDELLTRHFDGINTDDYAAYSATVSNPLSEADFGSVYSTTADSDGLIHQIVTDEAGVTRITLSFISQQSVEMAPPDLPSGCIAWTVVWTIDGPAEDLRVGASDSSKTQKVPCVSP